MENEEQNNQCQIIYDYDLENVIYSYEITKTKYIASSLISNGRLGPISSFQEINSDQFVAIKKISNVYDNPTIGKNVLKKLSILSFVNHPNIIKLQDIVIPERDDYKDIYLIEEYMGSNLERLILSKYDYKNDEKLIPFIIYQILEGLHYLHTCKIMHRNIKASNILIDEKGRVKICGFGNAISFDDYENTYRGETNDFISEKGNLTNMAPEFLGSKKKNKSNYDEKIDLWGVGCIMAELYTQIFPFFPSLKNSKSKWISQISGIFKKLGKPDKTEIPTFASKERTKEIKTLYAFKKMEKNELFPNIKDEKVIDLIEKLLCINPQKRITLKEVINHPYFDVIKEYKDEDDFKDSDKIFVNKYKQKIEEMEKRNDNFDKQIAFYKEQILSEQKDFINKSE